MKKNEVPERIWLAIDRGAVWTTNPDSKKYIEYTRIDAFTEKACVWIKENLLKHTYVYEGEVGIGMAVFLEEFKQAMKGEI